MMLAPANSNVPPPPCLAGLYTDIVRKGGFQLSGRILSDLQSKLGYLENFLNIFLRNSSDIEVVQLT